MKSIQRSDISPVDQRVEVPLRETWLQFLVQLWEIATKLGQKIGHRRLEGKGNADRRFTDKLAQSAKELNRDRYCCIIWQGLSHLSHWLTRNPSSRVFAPAVNTGLILPASCCQCCVSRGNPHPVLPVEVHLFMHRPCLIQA